MLVECQECGNAVADTAQACPNCGARKPAASGAHVAKLVFLFIVLLATVSAAASALEFQPEPTRTMVRLLLLGAMLPALQAGFTVMFGAARRAVRYLMISVGLAFLAAVAATVL